MRTPRKRILFFRGLGPRILFLSIVLNMASRISRKQANIQASRLSLAGKISRGAPPWAPWALKYCLGLAGLPVVPSLGLVWHGPALPALPSPGPARPPSAAGGGCAAVVVVVVVEYYLF